MVILPLTWTCLVSVNYEESLQKTEENRGLKTDPKIDLKIKFNTTKNLND